MNLVNATENSIVALDDFLGSVDISRFRKDLRNLFLHYLMEEYEQLGPEFGHFIEDMKFFFNFLDALETNGLSENKKAQELNSLQQTNGNQESALSQ